MWLMNSFLLQAKMLSVFVFQVNFIEQIEEWFTTSYPYLRSHRQLMVLEKGKSVFFREDALNKETDEFLVCSTENVTGQDLQ